MASEDSNTKSENSGLPGKQSSEGGTVQFDDLVAQFDQFSQGKADNQDLVAEPAKPSTATTEAENQPGDDQVSITSIDQALAEQDPNFQQSLGDIQNDLSADHLGDMGLDMDAVLANRSAAEAAVQPQADAPKLSFDFKKSIKILFDYVLLPIHLAGSFFSKRLVKLFLFLKQQTLFFIKEGYKKPVAQIKAALGFVGQSLSRKKTVFMRMSVQQKVLILFSLVLLLGSVFLLNKTLGPRWWPAFEKPILTNFRDVADAQFEYGPLEELQEIDSALTQPDFTVHMDKIVVNLKRPSGTQLNSMAAFDLYIECSSQEAAVEVRDRERQLRDGVQRVVEEFTYRELDTIDGKNNVKIAIKQEINQVLNFGHVQKVYFKTLILKP